MALAASCSLLRTNSFSSLSFTNVRRSWSPSSGEKSLPLSPSNTQPLPDTWSSNAATSAVTSGGGLFPPSSHQRVTGGWLLRAGNSKRIFNFFGYIYVVKPEHSPLISFVCLLSLLSYVQITA